MAAVAPRAPAKQEEQDETTNKQQKTEMVSAIDPDCPSRDIQVPILGYQSKLECKHAEKRREFQKRDPCMQRSNLFDDSLLDAPADDRKRTSYGNFYQGRKYVSGGRPAGIATGDFPIKGKLSCVNKNEW